MLTDLLYENDEKQAVILAIDPTTTIATAGNEKLVPLAQTVKTKLTRALEILS